MGRLETNAYYALGAPLYLLLIAIEYAVARRRRRRVFAFADTLGNLSAGLGEVIIGIFIGPALIALYDFGYRHLALVRWPEGSIAPWLIAFVVSDLCYYWYHRAGHQIAAFWSIHGVHHQSEQFNVTVAMRHPWFSDTYSALFYLPLPMLGVPPTVFFIAISIISFYALSIHTRFFNRPSWFLFTTPATHVLHHATNRRYIGKNLGAMFTLWDRLFGTYVELDPDDPPRLGTRAGYGTHDGALSQWLFPRRMLQAAIAARTLGDRLRVFFGPPGFLPRGVVLPRPPRAREDAAIPLALRVYALAQMALVVAVSLLVLFQREHYSLGVLAGAAVLVLFGLSCIGGLLDGRAASVRFELGRLGLSGVLGAAYTVQRGYGAAAWIALAVFLLGSASFLWLVRESVPDRRARDRLPNLSFLA